MRKIALVLVLPIVFFIMLNAVFAADYSIEKVTVNGMEAGADKIALQIGANAQVDVLVKGEGSQRDVRAKAWIGGYEYDDVYTESEIFDVKPGIKYLKELNLELPRDMAVIEGHEYTLHIEVKDRNNYISREFTVYLEPKRHDINIQDVIISPSTMADAGKTIAVQARIENFGEKAEKNIKIEASLAQFGVSAITYVDALDAYEGEDTSESSSFLMLNIPSDALTGDYQLKVKAIFASGHSEVAATRNIYVKGKDTDEKYSEELAEESVVAISAGKELYFNQTAIFKVAVANIGNAKKEYALEVPSIEWGIMEIKPASMELSPGDASEFAVAVLPGVAGMQQLTIKLKEGSTIIKENTLGITVIKTEQKDGGVSKLNNILKGVDKRTVMLALAGVLVLALLIAVIAGTRPRY